MSSQSIKRLRASTPILMVGMMLLSGCATMPSQIPPAEYDHSATTAASAKVDLRQDVTQISRYTTVPNGPTMAQINPLQALSHFKFQPSVYTVGQAVEHVLATTGYRLAPRLSPAVKNTLNKPLPLTNRKLGPMTITQALQVLMGKEVFQLERDPLNRLVNFKVKPAIAEALGVPTNG